MKTKVILILFILVCIGIMTAGCSSPSTSSQGNYQQQSNQVNTQSSSNLDPIVGCWVNYRNTGVAGTYLKTKFKFDSNGGGYTETSVTSQNAVTPSIGTLSWEKLSSIEYGIKTGNIYTILQYSKSSNTLTSKENSNFVLNPTSC